MRGPLALCSLPLLCHGLRHEQRRQEPSRPVGRHIQYLGNSYGSGIGDRVGILIWLTDLGNYWNATIHMKGGPSGAAAYLNSKHSKNVSSNWSTYFDLGGGCGIDPFNEVEDFDGCVPVTDPQTDFSRLFGEGQGDGCVNLMERRWTYKGHWDQGSARRCDVWAEGLAPGIYNASKSFLASHGVPARFGAYHIRRCDRLNTNEVCTDPEAARGGDLHEVYMRKDFWGAEEHARFYAACVVSGLEYLHDRRIIYRDLKMENVVLDQRGYAKICDFGMSRFLWPSIGTAYTICGTPEYQAPEINAGTGYDHAVDWWALGILLYELMMGATPFLAESAAGVHKNVSAGIDKVIPQAQRGSWSSLVCSLCQQEPGKRLPLLSGGVENVRRHPWFQESALEWSKLHSGHLVAPYVPQLDGAKAIGHFNVKEEVCPPQDPPQCAADTAWDEDYEDPVGPYVCEAGCHHQA